MTAGLAIYFHIRILSAPFVLANYGVLGSVLGRGRTDLGLLLQVAINLTHIGADADSGSRPRTWAWPGAALATLGAGGDGTRTRG
ncbi:hypothetical protein ACU4GR_00290 [Methylobacterium oryzae CBMB20]